jgi:hypothetical protein
MREHGVYRGSSAVLLVGEQVPLGVERGSGAGVSEAARLGCGRSCTSSVEAGAAVGRLTSIYGVKAIIRSRTAALKRPRPGQRRHPLFRAPIVRSVG